MRVPVKCETKSKRNETKRNETKRNRNEIGRNVSVSFRFRFAFYRFALFLLFLDIDACDFKSLISICLILTMLFVYSHLYIMCF